MRVTSFLKQNAGIIVTSDLGINLSYHVNRYFSTVIAREIRAVASISK